MGDASDAITVFMWPAAAFDGAQGAGLKIAIGLIDGGLGCCSGCGLFALLARGCGLRPGKLGVFAALVEHTAPT